MLYQLRKVGWPVAWSALVLALSMTTAGTAGASQEDGQKVVPIVSSLLFSGFHFQDQQLVDITVNGGLETGSISGGGWDTGDLAIETGNVYSGTYSGRLDGATAQTSGTYSIAVTPGEVYTFSCAAACEDVPNWSGIAIRQYDASGTEIEVMSVASLLGTREWRTYSVPNFRIREDAVKLEIRVRTAADSKGSVTYFDNFKLQRNDGLPIDAVPTYESAGVTVLSQSATAESHIYFRKTGSHTWHEAYSPMLDDDVSDVPEFRTSMVNLEPDTDYQVYATLVEGDKVIAQGGASFSTWTEEPVIGKTYNVADLYSGGKLDLTGISGTPDAWVKIVGTGNDDIDADYATNEAILLYNNQYVILENIEIKGGRLYGIHLNHCHAVRVRNCKISGWARTPGYVYNYRSYESEAAYNANPDNPINLDGGIYLDQSHEVTIERCYLHDPRLSANYWVGTIHPAGPEGIVVRAPDESTTSTVIRPSDVAGNYVIRYNDIIGSDDVRWNDGIEGYNNDNINSTFARDSDIYGNMIAYGQDDAIELDGGQENVRFFGNKAQGFFCGISVAPNRQGPSYIFRNVLFGLADERGSSNAMVKQGGGSWYTRGTTYFFNNTFYSKAYNRGGLAGVGFGNQGTPERYRFYAVSRNNIIYNRSETNAINDSLKLTRNDFDFDNLTTGSLATAKVVYSDGQEANGILDNPPTFMDMDETELHDDIRLAADSSAIDAGTKIANFVETYSGKAPDQGAVEYGSSSLFPIRPIDFTADRYRLTLEATAGGSTTTQSATVTAGDIGDEIGYTVMQNDTTGWLQVTPSSGTFKEGSSETFSFSVDTSAVSSGVTRKAVVLVRLDNGYSVPLTVEATVN